jgi:hypothetical protein
MYVYCCYIVTLLQVVMCWLTLINTAATSRFVFTVRSFFLGIDVFFNSEEEDSEDDGRITVYCCYSHAAARL